MFKTVERIASIWYNQLNEFTCSNIYWGQTNVEDNSVLNSNERIDYINSYLSAYENKIKMANKQGLFDAAKMFELFALNVCALWYGQPFKNLNTEVANYPYVDLISEDQRLFVQVSTVQDIAGKIKSTLEKIRDSSDSRFSSVENIVFFVLQDRKSTRLNSSQQF